MKLYRLVSLIAPFFFYISLSSVTAQNEEKEVDLVIIGAGMSGIAAAAHLLSRNFTNFVILEASNRFGGRVQTVPFAGGSIEAGAEYIHGKDFNPVYKLAASLGLVSQIDNGTPVSLYLKSDGTNIDPSLANIASDLHYTALFHPEDIRGNATSYGQFIERVYWSSVEPLIAAGNVTRKDAEAFLVWLEKSFNPLDGSPSWFQTSPYDEFQIDRNPANFFVVWKNGFNYSLIFDIVTRRLPIRKNELPIHERISFNKEVTLVDWSGSRVIVSCADNSKFSAKKVLTTVSLGVLKDKANTLFQPSLPPKKLQAIQALGISSYDKICLEFPYRWWPPNVFSINFIWTLEDKAAFENSTWVTDIYGFAQSEHLPLNVLCTMIGGAAAEAMEDQTPQEVEKETMRVLRKFTPQIIDIPDSHDVFRTRWRKNPFTRGGYSYRHVDCDKLGVDPSNLAEPICNAAGDEVLLFAGEATDDNHYATVQGALISGEKAAARII